MIVTPWRRLKLMRYLALTSLLWPWLLYFPLSIAETNCAQPEAATDPKSLPGQVWSYKTRPGEESSTATILRVEKEPKIGIVIHVHIEGVHFSNCTGGPAPEEIDHAPFTRAAIEASVTEKVRSISALPDYDAGYQDWLRHCGGVYTITVERMVAVDDATFSASLGCH
jgi:hypothetical protein